MGKEDLYRSIKAKEASLLEDRAEVPDSTEEVDDLVDEDEVLRRIGTVEQRLDESGLSGNFRKKIEKKLNKITTEWTQEVDSFQSENTQEFEDLFERILDDYDDFEANPEVKEIYQNLEIFFQNRNGIEAIINFTTYKRKSGDWEKINARLGLLGLTPARIEVSQKMLKITVDGQVGPETITAINRQIYGKDKNVVFGKETRHEEEAKEDFDLKAKEAATILEDPEWKTIEEAVSAELAEALTFDDIKKAEKGQKKKRKKIVQKFKEEQNAAKLEAAAEAAAEELEAAAAEASADSSAEPDANEATTINYEGFKQRQKGLSDWHAPQMLDESTRRLGRDPRESAMYKNWRALSAAEKAKFLAEGLDETRDTMQVDEAQQRRLGQIEILATVVKGLKEVAKAGGHGIIQSFGFWWKEVDEKAWANKADQFLEQKIPKLINYIALNPDRSLQEAFRALDMKTFAYFQKAGEIDLSECDTEEELSAQRAQLVSFLRKAKGYQEARLLCEDDLEKEFSDVMREKFQTSNRKVQMGDKSHTEEVITDIYAESDRKVRAKTNRQKLVGEMAAQILEEDPDAEIQLKELGIKADQTIESLIYRDYLHQRNEDITEYIYDNDTHEKWSSASKRELFNQYRDSIGIGILTPSDENWDAILDEVIINAPLILVSGGVASAIRAGGTKLATGAMSWGAKAVIGAARIEKLAVGVDKLYKASRAVRALSATGRFAGKAGGMLIEGFLFEATNQGLRGKWLLDSPDWVKQTVWTAATLGLFKASGRLGERLLKKPVLNALGKPMVDEAGKIITKQALLGTMTSKLPAGPIRAGVEELLVKGHVEVATMLLMGALQGRAEKGDITSSDAWSEWGEEFVDHFGDELFHSYLAVGALKTSGKLIKPITDKLNSPNKRKRKTDTDNAETETKTKTKAKSKKKPKPKKTTKGVKEGISARKQLLAELAEKTKQKDIAKEEVTATIKRVDAAIAKIDNLLSTEKVGELREQLVNQKAELISAKESLVKQAEGKKSNLSDPSAYIKELLGKREKNPEVRDYLRELRNISEKKLRKAKKFRLKREEYRGREIANRIGKRLKREGLTTETRKKLVAIKAEFERRLDQLRSNRVEAEAKEAKEPKKSTLLKQSKASAYIKELLRKTRTRERDPEIKGYSKDLKKLSKKKIWEFTEDIPNNRELLRVERVCRARVRKIDRRLEDRGLPPETIEKLIAIKSEFTKIADKLETSRIEAETKKMKEHEASVREKWKESLVMDLATSELEVGREVYVIRKSGIVQKGWRVSSIQGAELTLRNETLRQRREPSVKDVKINEILPVDALESRAREWSREIYMVEGAEVYVRTESGHFEKGWRIEGQPSEMGRYTLKNLEGKVIEDVSLRQILSVKDVETMKYGDLLPKKHLEFLKREARILDQNASLKEAEFNSLFGNQYQEGIIEQNNVGNCSFVAALNSLRRSPHFKTLMRLSIEKVRGGWEVRVPLGDPKGEIIRIRESDLVRSENPNYNQPDSQGQIDGRTHLSPLTGAKGFQILEVVAAKQLQTKKALFREYFSDSRSASEGGFGHRVLLELLGSEGMGKADARIRKIRLESSEGAQEQPTLTGWVTSKTFKEGTPSGRANLSKFFDSYDGAKHVATANTPPSPRREGHSQKFEVEGKTFSYSHAYSIKGVDTVNRNVIVINPWNTGKEIHLSYEGFMEVFNQISAVEINHSRLLEGFWADQHNEASGF